MRRLRPALVLAALGAWCACASASRGALAEDKRIEAAAKDAMKKAASDYLSTDYSAAASRLERAVRACAADNCTAATKAALLRDLGTMQLHGGDDAAALRSFGQALQLEPDLELNADYDAPEVRAAWQKAKGGRDTEQPKGDFSHTPASEQTTNTPLPIYVEYTGTGAPARVVVKYRGEGTSGWVRLELKRVGRGWGGLIPCSAVKSGAVRYWVQGFDDGGDPNGSSGDPKRPYSVPIKEELSGDAPHLPGRVAPHACEQAEEEEGESDEEAPAKPLPVTDERDRPFARVWIGVSGALPEFLSLPAGDDLCLLTPQDAPANSAGYYCTNPDGTDFPSRQMSAQNGTLVKGQAGHLDGGVQAGDVRVMLSVDYALTAGLLAGVRLGYVANSYTGAAASKDGKAFGSNVHAEVRVTYLLGYRPLSLVGFSPMVFGAIGLGEFDGHARSAIAVSGVVGQQPVDVWLTDGPAFVAVGGGVRYQFSARAAFTAAVRVNAAFGGNGVLPTYGPEIGVAYGF